MPDYKPKPHQEKAAKWIQNHGYQCFLCDEMGLGKTGTAILGVSKWMKQGRYLVVTPASLKLNWCEEFDHWLGENMFGLEPECKSTTNKDVRYIVDKETGKKRIGVVPSYYRPFITNYERLEKYYKYIKSQKFIGVIFDESHYLKNPKSQRTRLAIEIARTIPFVMCITGTPMVSGPQDLASQLDVMRLLDDFGGYKGFYERYCTPVKTKWGYDFLGVSNQRELHKKLKEFTIRRTKKSCGIKLPPKRVIDVPIMEFEQRYADSFEAIQRELRAVNKAKYPYIVEFIKNLVNNGKRPVVFAQHRHLIRDLCQEFEGQCLHVIGGQTAEKRQYNIKAFQAGEKPIIFCSLMASATGLTLTSSDTAVFLEYPWSPAVFDQAQDRIHRISQTRPVTVYSLYAKDSIESQQTIRAYIKRLSMEGVL